MINDKLEKFKIMWTSPKWGTIPELVKKRWGKLRSCSQETRRPGHIFS